MSTAQPYQWTSCAATHIGHVRSINEDAYLDRDDQQLWVVADGMGGHHAGDVASHSIVEALKDIPKANQLSIAVNNIEDCLLDVNAHLRSMAQQHSDHRTIGSTVMAMAALNHHCALLWAGDSRAYRSRNGSFVQLTRDHSQIEEMVDRGLISREDADSHPASNVITRAVGAMDELYIDVDVDEVESGDTFLLCSDGLYKHITETELAEVLKNDNLQEICDSLIDLTLQRGAMDNVTIVLVRAV